MSLMNSLMQKQKMSGQRSSIQYQWHLVVCVLVLLVVMYLSVTQIDLFVTSHVEFKTLFNAGAMAHTPYSIIDAYFAVVEYSAQHTPGYFMFLHTWGNIFSWDVAIARIPAIFAGLLSLAMAYRLAHDFVAPIGGVFAIIILASSTFYAFYIPQIRMYPFMLLINMMVVWLYLRMIYQQRTVHRYDYLALFITSFLSLWVHIFSVLILGMLGVYHLSIAPKTRRWWWVSASVSAAVLAMSPYFLVILRGMNRAVDKREERIIGFVDTIELIVSFFYNGQLLLLGITIVGLAVCVWRYRQLLKPYLLLAPIFLIFSGVMAEVVSVVTESGMRYFLGGWAVFLLLVVVALVALYRLHRATALVLVLFVWSGINFSSTTDWEPYLEGRHGPYLRSPIHAIARLAQAQPDIPAVISYHGFDIYMTYEDNINYSQQTYFFDDAGIDFDMVADESELREVVNLFTITEPTIWVFYKQSLVDEENLDVLDGVMSETYQLCETQPIGTDSFIQKYYWKVLDCQLPQVTQHFVSSVATYDWSQVKIVGNDLVIVDKWEEIDGVDADGYNMSYQLLTGDWDKVAQLDLPLVNESNYRMFSLDITDVPADSYRLVTILYNANTGEEIEWFAGEQSLGNLIPLVEVAVE